MCVCVCECVCVNMCVSHTQFRDVQMAYEILSDSEKRELYDRFGMDGVRDGAGSSSFPGGGGSGSSLGWALCNEDVVLFRHVLGGTLFSNVWRRHIWL